MKIVFDIKLERPACALLQAVMGGDAGIANRFDVDDWLLAPTPDMKCYEVTSDQLKYLIARVGKRKDWPHDTKRRI